MKEKNQWQAIAEKEAVVATQVIERLHWLTPGTYSARDVHQAIIKRCGPQYFTLENAVELSKGLTFDVSYLGGTFKYPLSNIFYELSQAERNCGRGKKYRHQWTVAHPGKEITGTSLTFPSQKVMKKLSGKLPKIFGMDAVLIFDLKKDTLTLNDELGVALTLNIFDYNMENIPSVIAYIHPRMLRNLYGECSLKVFSGPESEEFSVMITNADGWSTHLKCETYSGNRNIIERQRT